MSTRSTTHFIAGGHEAAIVYRHADGYPEGHGKDLQEFFEAVEADTKDTRFSDPSYLASKLVVWLARKFAVTYDRENNYEPVSHADERPLDFISVGICLQDPTDIEFLYEVDCGRFDDRKRPTVRCYDVVYEGPAKIGKGELVDIPA